MSPKRSRSRSSHRDDRKKYKRRHSPDRSRSGSRRGEDSSSSTGRASSRSASPSEKHRKGRSYRTSGKREERSRSYTPDAGRKDSKDSKDRNDPNECHCLGVFGLSSYTQEKDLRDVFSQYGDIDDICIIYDRQSGHSKGYGFVYFKSTSDAVEARRNTQGLVLDRRPIRVDYSMTTRPHSPTPGRYLGRRSNRDYDRGGRDDRSGRDYERSGRDYERSSRDYERSSRDNEKSSRDYEKSSRDYEKSSRDYEKSSRDYDRYYNDDDYDSYRDSRKSGYREWR